MRISASDCRINHPSVAFPRPFELGTGSKLFFVGHGTPRSPKIGKRVISPFSCKIGLSNHLRIWPEQIELFVFWSFSTLSVSLLRTYSSTSPAGLLAASGTAVFTASTISRMIAKSWALKLPGGVCSIVSLTSGPISLAHVAKNTMGLLGWESLRPIGQKSSVRENCGCSIACSEQKRQIHHAILTGSKSLASGRD